MIAPQVAMSGVASANVVSDDSVSVTSAIERTTITAMVSRPAQTINVSTGETLASLAMTYHTDVASLRWANDIEDGQSVVVGTTLLVPPGSGALVRVKAGERPSQVAARLGFDARVLLDYNALQRDAPLPSGTYLQVPEPLAPHDSLLSSDAVPISEGVPGVSRDQRSHGNIYPYGQCTWYVASRRDVGWTGNAWQWWTAARGIRPEGHAPVANAIVVMSTGWVGHVGIVDKVNADGTFVMSEMNYYGTGGGWGRVDQRTISPDEPWITGFIY